MYGGSVGPLLAIAYLLSTGWSFGILPSVLAIADHSTSDCSDEDLLINIRCRRSGTALGLNSVTGARRERTSRDGCCALTRQALLVASFADLSNMQPNCEWEKRNDTHPSDAAVLQSCTGYELRSCQGDEVHFLCNVTRNRRYRVTWRSPTGDVIFRGPSLVVPDVRRTDGGIYSCEASTREGKTLMRRQVNLIVQFPPVILVPNELQVPSSASDDELPRTSVPRLHCAAEAVPAAKVTWYRDSTAVDNTMYSTTTENKNCVTRSFLEFHSYRRRVVRSSFVNFSTDHNELFYGNYTCTATNDFGQDSKVISFSGFEWELFGQVEEFERRPFNVTGFIVGMLPPLFISFYIILKLGYRSRYAAERGEDDGYGEEPFFVGY